MTLYEQSKDVFDSDPVAFTNEIYNVDRKTLEMHLVYAYHQQKEMADAINDLILSLSMHLQEYPFDAHHKIKQLRLIDNACKLIGKPRTIEELKEIVLKIKEEM